MDIHEEDNFAEIYRRNRIEEDTLEQFKKKLTIIVLILIAIAFISLIIYMFNRTRTINEYFDKHPNTEWVSTEPYIHILVNENGEATSYMEIDGESTQVRISAHTVCRITYIERPEGQRDYIDDEYMEGRVWFHYNRIVLKITNDNVFNGKYPEIVLYRVG